MSDLVKPIELDKMHTEAECYDVGDGMIALMFSDATHWSILVLKGCAVVGYDMDTLPVTGLLSEIAAAAVQKFEARTAKDDSNLRLCSSCLRKIN